MAKGRYARERAADDQFRRREGGTTGIPKTVSPNRDSTAYCSSQDADRAKIGTRAALVAEGCYTIPKSEKKDGRPAQGDDRSKPLTLRIYPR
jgi:hypothetical protein